MGRRTPEREQGGEKKQVERRQEKRRDAVGKWEERTTRAMPRGPRGRTLRASSCRAACSSVSSKPMGRTGSAVPKPRTPLCSERRNICPCDENCESFGLADSPNRQKVCIRLDSVWRVLITTSSKMLLTRLSSGWQLPVARNQCHPLVERPNTGRR